MRYPRLLESRRKIEVCWHTITDKKKKTRLLTQLSGKCREILFCSFLSIPMTRRSITMIIVIMIIKKASSQFGRKFDKLIIGSTSRACPYFFNLEFVWISWSCQHLCFLPHQANCMWSSIGWDSLSRRKLIQNRSVSYARSIWRYELKFRKNIL